MMNLQFQFIIISLIIQLSYTFHTPTIQKLPSSFITSQQRKQKLQHRHYERIKPLNMINDFFSGITGQAPKSSLVNESVLETILNGTNIDPIGRNNVDLECVYKASRDGWSAIDFHNNCDGRGMFYYLRTSNYV